MSRKGPESEGGSGSRRKHKPQPSEHHLNLVNGMVSHTPKGDPPGAARRGSLSGASQFRASAGPGFSRPQTSLRESRLRAPHASSVRGTSTQPSYNLFTGESRRDVTAAMARPGSRQQSIPSGPSPPRGRAATAGSSFSRESSKENLAPPDAEVYERQRRQIEELKADVNTLRYQINNYEQEKELVRLQMENEVRDTKRRAEEDFKAKQAADGDKTKALRHVEALQTELESLRADHDTQKRELEARARDAQEEARLLQEQLEDLSAAKDEAARMAERGMTDLRARISALERTAQETEQESRTREDVLERTQALLAERDETLGSLEADVLRLKAQTGDAETISVIRRELSDQVTHIRMLEAKNRDQLAELKHLRQTHKAVEVVEEEKRSLQRRMEAYESLEAELAEERTQRQRLEDERRAWTAYLESTSNSDHPIEFDSPEAVARALIEERLKSASLLERLGSLQPEIADRDNIIRTLEDEKHNLRSQIEKLKTAGGANTGNDKARARLDRQRALAVKEVEYLRAQLKTFDMEDMTLAPESVDEQKMKRIQDLEDLVDKYKQEVDTLHADLSSTESTSTSPSTNPAQPLTGTKRLRDDADLEADSEQLGQLARKNRKLQADLSEAQTALQLLQKEHEVSTSQLASAKEQLKTRVLALRSNPTSDFEAVKTSTLAALKLENAELVAHIQRQPTLFATIPASQLAAAQREVAEARAETASSQKSSRRLKEVWAAKSAEFKEAVFSTLGWTVSFIPGGKMRVESVYHPSVTDEHENSIVFDGEKGTMKVGGGPKSAFANRIGDNIKFWVRERGCVPCFLAALTLEFYDEHTRAVRPS
ncbi:spindle assembly checkpoint component Mad1 [Podospora appendiculata]|uniref:Spindle assembly checkpoint component MAD1 n=1 Tax=Podospora appendiculata TaxID=314037 RepID=A0AAE1CBM9_9PEZI|nr:spindle assembly checkpoint component Mad1 [Podospora appendiculata]